MLQYSHENYSGSLLLREASHFFKGTTTTSGVEVEGRLNAWNAAHEGIAEFVQSQVEARLFLHEIPEMIKGAIDEFEQGESALTASEFFVALVESVEARVAAVRQEITSGARGTLPSDQGRLPALPRWLQEKVANRYLAGEILKVEDLQTRPEVVEARERITSWWLRESSER